MLCKTQSNSMRFEFVKSSRQMCKNEEFWNITPTLVKMLPKRTQEIQQFEFVF